MLNPLLVISPTNWSRIFKLTTVTVWLISTPTPEGLARVAGLIEPSVDFKGGDSSDEGRMAILSWQISALNDGSEARAVASFHETAATYLPAIIRSFREKDDLLSPATILLNSVSDTAVPIDRILFAMNSSFRTARVLLPSTPTDVPDMPRRWA